MRKILCVLALATVSASILLAGCGQSPGNDSTSDKTVAPPQQGKAPDTAKKPQTGGTGAGGLGSAPMPGPPIKPK